MASWPTGIESVKELIASNNLRKVAASRQAAGAMLDAASRHIDSAIVVTETDPDGAYSLLYDAARKSLAAVLQVQGPSCDQQGRPLRTPGGDQRSVHHATTREAFRPSARMRRTRNQIEYDDISQITADDVLADEAAARALHSMAIQLVEVLPVFVD